MPKPQRHAFICSQGRPAGHPRSSCGEQRCQAVLDEFMFEFQQRQFPSNIAVTPSGCLGPCGRGPNVLVYPEGILYVGVSPADVSKIFEEHLIGGKPVEALIAPADLW